MGRRVHTHVCVSVLNGEANFSDLTNQGWLPSEEQTYYSCNGSVMGGIVSPKKICGSLNLQDLRGMWTSLTSLRAGQGSERGVRFCPAQHSWGWL